jgi:hypothetical protein
MSDTVSEIMRRVQNDSKNSQGNYEAQRIHVAWDAHARDVLDSLAEPDRNRLLDLLAEMVRDADPYRPHWPTGDNIIHLPVRPKTPPGMSWDFFLGVGMARRVQHQPGFPWHETDPVTGNVVLSPPRVVIDLRTPLSTPNQHVAQASGAAVTGGRASSAVTGTSAWASSAVTGTSAWASSAVAETRVSSAVIGTSASSAVTAGSRASSTVAETRASSTAVYGANPTYQVIQTDAAFSAENRAFIDALANAAANVSAIGPMDVLFSAASGLPSLSENFASMPPIDP